MPRLGPTSHPAPYRPLLLVVALALPANARAHSGLDMIEHIFGATNIHAVTGHGGTALGVSARGDATVLTWPSPSSSDQLTYLSSNALDARDQPRLGAPRGAGVFVGLVVQGKGHRKVIWLRDPSVWQIAQDYGPTDGPNVHTRFESADLGLTVELTDAIEPGGAGGPRGEVWVRRIVVSRAATSPVDKLWLLGYANLAPTPPSSKLPELPIADWATDGRNDFAAVWDEAARAVVHFHPGDLRIIDSLGALILPSDDYGSAAAVVAAGTPSAATLATFAGALDELFAPGAYAAFTTVPPPDQHQVGHDATPMCAMIDGLIDHMQALPAKFPGFEAPIDPGVLGVLRCGKAHEPVQVAHGWKNVAEDSLADAADGELSGAGMAVGEVNAALRAPLVFEPVAGGGQRARGAMVFGLGPTAATARAAMKAGLDADGVVQDAEKALAAWLAGRRLPVEASPEVLAVARRALINVRVGTDRETGAIVASIARQPPYGLDWPRDGAFFNALLAVSGQDTLLARRLSLYAKWQRKAPVPPTPLVDVDPPVDPRTGSSQTYPSSAWEMNYYADGTPGGNVRFEIDNTGFALWSLVAHAPWKQPAAAHAALEKRWDAIAGAADLLAAWRNPETGLQAPAQEDDNAAFTATLHGAVTTFGALDLAGRAARLLGRDEAAARWEARALELRCAILKRLYDAARGLFVRGPGEVFNPGSQPTGPTAWLVWPARLLSPADPRVSAQLRADLEAVTPTIELKTAGGAYFLKNLVAAAFARRDASATGAEVRGLLGRVAGLATAGTRHFGEVMLAVGEGEGRHASQRVANPHLWEGALFYLTAMALEDPASLTPFEGPGRLPPSRLPPVPAPVDASGGHARDSDGGCGSTGCGAVPLPALALLALCALGLCLRRGERRSSGDRARPAGPAPGKPA